MFRFKTAPMVYENAYLLCEIKRKDGFQAVKYRKIAEGTRAEMEKLQGRLELDTMVVPPFARQEDGTMTCRTPEDSALFFRGFYNMI